MYGLPYTEFDPYPSPALWPELVMIAFLDDEEMDLPLSQTRLQKLYQFRELI
jgi:hypothetical protein